MNQTVLIALYAIVDLIFIVIVIIGLTRGVRIDRLLPAILIVLLSNSLWFFFNVRKKR
jgi:hypothetical protein